MARFYFHHWCGRERLIDREGSELTDAESAYMEAFEAARELTIDLIRNRKSVFPHRFDVADELGRVLFELPFSEVVGGRAKPHRMEAALERSRALVADVTSEVEKARETLANLRRSL